MEFGFVDAADAGSGSPATPVGHGGTRGPEAVRAGVDGTPSVTVNGVPIWESDVQAVAPGQWVNDNILDFFANYLLSGVRAEKRALMHLFGCPFFSTLGGEGYYAAAARFVENLNVDGLKFLLIPVFWASGHHFALVAVDLFEVSLFQITNAQLLLLLSLKGKAYVLYRSSPSSSILTV